MEEWREDVVVPIKKKQEKIVKDYRGVTIIRRCTRYVRRH